MPVALHSTLSIAQGVLERGYCGEECLVAARVSLAGLPGGAAKRSHAEEPSRQWRWHGSAGADCAQRAVSWRCSRGVVIDLLLPTSFTDAFVAPVPLV